MFSYTQTFLSQNKIKIVIAYHKRSSSRNVLERSSQLLQNGIEVGEGDWAADVQQDGVLLPLGSLEVLPLAEQAGVFDGAELVYADGDAAVEQDEEGEADADLQTGVDVHQDDGQEGADPEEAIQL